MTVVDTAVVGRLGGQELGAVGLANAIFFVCSVLGTGTMMGLDPLVSQALGRKDAAGARGLLWQGVWLAFLVGLGLSLPIAFGTSFLTAVGIEPAVVGLVGQYLGIRMFALIPLLLFVGLRAYLQAHAITRPMVVSTIVANVFNLVADILLVFGGASLPLPSWLSWARGLVDTIPAMGVRGAAIATLLCTILQFAIIVLAVRALKVPGFEPKRRGFATREAKQAFLVGLPIGLQMGAEVGIFALVGLLAGRLGGPHLAAHQISLTLVAFSFCVAVGIGAAGSVRVGRAVGAGDAVGVRRSGLVAFAGGSSFMALSSLLYLLFPGPLAGLLTNDAAAIEAAIPLIRVAAVFQLSDGIQGVGAGVLRGAGDTRYAFLANLVGHYAIGLPVALALTTWFDLGVSGLWWGLCVGLTVVGGALLRRFLRLSAKPIRPIATGATVAPVPSGG